MPLSSNVAMAFALALYRWVDHRRAARAVVVAVLLVLARLWHFMQRRVNGVHHMNFPLKTLLLQPPAEAPESVSCHINDCGRNEVKAEAPEVSSVIYQCMNFRVGDFVTYPDAHRGQITAIDEDGDLIVRTDHGRKAVWYVSKCTKSLSAGDRVQHACRAVGHVVDFDEEGDLYVQKTDGSSARWYVTKTTRLLSVGDAVKYVSGDMATVIGFDSDGDVLIATPSGRRATWFANKCL